MIKYLKQSLAELNLSEALVVTLSLEFPLLQIGAMVDLATGAQDDILDL